MGRKAKIKTIDIQAREWFDKLNGNSYFSAVVTINYGTKTEKTIKVPFQYGYGSHYEHVALEAIKKQFNLKTKDKMPSFYCRENNIILRSSIELNCLKRDCVALVA